MGKDGGVPWPVWAVVTILAALIGTFGKLLVEQPPSTATPDRIVAPIVERVQPPIQPSAPVPAAASQINWTSRVGLYSGASINRLSYSRGATLFDLKAVEPSGKVRAAVEWSQGLSGSGTLVGTVSDNAVDLSGTILSNETGIWDCDVRMTFTSDTSIQGTYRLFPRPGNPFGTQDGEFVLDRIR